MVCELYNSAEQQQSSCWPREDISIPLCHTTVINSTSCRNLTLQVGYSAASHQQWHCVLSTLDKASTCGKSQTEAPYYCIHITSVTSFTPPLRRAATAFTTSLSRSMARSTNPNQRSAVIRTAVPNSCLYYASSSNTLF